MGLLEADPSTQMTVAMSVGNVATMRMTVRAVGVVGEAGDHAVQGV